jgi:hypothetical protein
MKRISRRENISTLSIVSSGLSFPSSPDTVPHPRCHVMTLSSESGDSEAKLRALRLPFHCCVSLRIKSQVNGQSELEAGTIEGTLLSRPQCSKQITGHLSPNYVFLECHSLAKPQEGKCIVSPEIQGFGWFLSAASHAI